MTRDEIKSVLATVQMLWPHSPVYPRGLESLAVDTWLMLLHDLDRDAVLACIQGMAIEGRDHSPPVGVIRERAVAMLAEVAGEAVPSIADAWAEVVAAIGRHGRSSSPTWTHGAVQTAVAAVGWVNLCNATNADVSFANFRRVYEQIATRRTRQQALPPQVRQTLEAVAARLALTRGDDHAETTD